MEENTILAITVPKSLREVIRKRAKKLGYMSESEYARELLRRDVRMSVKDAIEIRNSGNTPPQGAQEGV